MIEQPVINAASRKLIDAFTTRPSHALGLVAPLGMGKYTIANYLAAEVLGIAADRLEFYPYYHHVQPTDGIIGVEQAREIIGLVKLRTSGERDIRRIIVIEHADVMTPEAQNAVLKLIEEPPADTLLILTINDETAMLKTIWSRIQSIHLHASTEPELLSHFGDTAEVRRAYLLSGGMPGLMHALLHDDTEHPLVQAIADAKTLLASDTFDRLSQIDRLIKQKQLPNLLFGLSVIAHSALVAAAEKGATKETLKRWTTILTETTRAQEQLQQSAQAKLVMTNLFLSL